MGLVAFAAVSVPGLPAPAPAAQPPPAAVTRLLDNLRAAEYDAPRLHSMGIPSLFNSPVPGLLPLHYLLSACVASMSLSGT